MAPDTIERSLPALERPGAVPHAVLHRRPVGRRRQRRHVPGRQPGDGPHDRHGARLRRARRRGARSPPPTARGPRGATCSPQDRCAIVRRWYDLMLAHKADLALILTTEQGKPLAEAERGDRDRRRVRRVVRGGRQARLRRRDPDHRQDRRLVVVKQPVGVCAAITPWNFPCSMITRKVAPALAAGCTVDHQAGGGHAVLRAGAGRARASRRVSAAACST